MTQHLRDLTSEQQEVVRTLWALDAKNKELTAAKAAGRVAAVMAEGGGRSPTLRRDSAHGGQR